MQYIVYTKEQLVRATDAAIIIEMLEFCPSGLSSLQLASVESTATEHHYLCSLLIDLLYHNTHWNVTADS